MAVVAIATAWWGGLPFALLWTAASAVIAFEWQRIVHRDQGATAAGRDRGRRLRGGGGGLSRGLACAASPSSSAFRGGLASSEGPSRAQRPKASSTPPRWRRASFSAAASRRTADRRALAVRRRMGHGHLRLFHRPRARRAEAWPSVSPKKTWSGALGGLVGGAALGPAGADGGRRTASLAASRPVARLFCGDSGGGPLRIEPEAPLRRQGCGFDHSRTWRRDGPA